MIYDNASYDFKQRVPHLAFIGVNRNANRLKVVVIPTPTVGCLLW